MNRSAASSPPAGDSETITDGIRVHAVAQYLDLESEPDRPHHVFAYKITMTNVGEARARLISRHWIVVDAAGERRDVRGAGVIGEFPELDPGESFDYVSRCPLTTSWGTMEGSFRFERVDGSCFDAAVGRFFLVPSNRDAFDH